ncbi:hypothetical protein GCM10020331_101530 [Ectobacillus funiculus]
MYKKSKKREIFTHQKTFNIKIETIKFLGKLLELPTEDIELASAEKVNLITGSTHIFDIPQFR